MLPDQAELDDLLFHLLHLIEPYKNCPEYLSKRIGWDQSMIHLNYFCQYCLKNLNYIENNKTHIKSE